jgi:hypothetical protein
MVHMATLVHDDLVDGARLRRGLPAAWSVYGADAAKAAGDYLYACAFRVLSDTGDGRAVATLAEAALCLARGEAMQKLQTHDPATRRCVPRRCGLKTEADRGRVPARLRRDARRYGLASALHSDRRRHPRLCRRDTATGRSPAPTCASTPTMPLLLAAARDATVPKRSPVGRRRARRGRRDRRARALARRRTRYAAARALLGDVRIARARGLTYAVVDRAG